jgi:endonuclease-3
MNKKEKKELGKRVVEALKKQYPVAICSLEYDGSGYKLLVMGRLSAQCTDERVNIVCKELFKVYPTPKDLADADVLDIERIIRPCGLYKTKAKSLKSMCQRLVYELNGVIPDTMQELLLFDGVGRKIANLILGDLYHKPAIVADTHCMRICGRLGFYQMTKKDPLATEKIMSEIIEPSEQSDFCHRLVLFGREFCTAKGPKCNICPLKNMCVSAQKEKK